MDDRQRIKKYNYRKELFKFTLVSIVFFKSQIVDLYSKKMRSLEMELKDTKYVHLFE